jgi:aminoglycoside phosphotransferase (APT) family kinase protein
VGPLHARLITGGRSNLTYEVRDDAHAWIVRRPPLGHVLETAHNMAREFRVISALHRTAVPVPAPYALCLDPDVIGAPFYVMQRVEGTPYRAADQLAALGPNRVQAIALRMVETLGALHTVGPEAVGLGDLGRPAGFFERQVRRWHQQLNVSRSRPLRGMDDLHDQLVQTTPVAGPPSIVHGDYRLDNLLVNEDDRVMAVVDWEMATLGDPSTDVGLFIVYQRLSRIPGGTAITDVSTAPGYPGENDLLAHYASSVGREVTCLGPHIALGYFKLAVILEGIHYRHCQGQTVGPGFERVGRLVEPLIQAGLTTLREDT